MVDEDTAAGLRGPGIRALEIAGVFVFAFVDCIMVAGGGRGVDL
jgi:hypothetical protein